MPELGTEPRGRFFRWLPWALVGLGVVVALVTHRDFGATYDEGLQARYGELCLDYFRSGGRDRSCNEYFDLRYYGPLVEIVPALFYTPGGPGKYELRHLILGLMALASIPGMWLFARRIGDPRTAVFAVLAMVMTPRFVGHWFNNSKDVPFAVAVLLFMAALARAFTGERVRWSRALVAGLAMGAGLCARPGGFSLFGLFLASAAGVWLVTRDRAAGADSVLGVVPKVALIPIVAWPMMVAPWPWAHGNPLAHPIEAMRAVMAFPTGVPVLFGGTMVHSGALPWDYVARQVAITTPLPILGLALAGLLFGVRRQWAAPRTRDARVIALAQVWLFAPLALFVLVRPHVYAGMRHFLFVLPALAFFAGLGASELLARLRSPAARRAGGAVLCLLLLSPLPSLVRLHPYQMTFFNSLVGGTAGAEGRYWTDYWHSSYAEAIAWVNERAREAPEREWTVVIAAGEPVMLWARDYAGDNVRLVSTRELTRGAPLAPADYYIGTTRSQQDRLFPEAPVVHRGRSRGGRVRRRQGFARAVRSAAAPPCTCRWRHGTRQTAPNILIGSTHRLTWLSPASRQVTGSSRTVNPSRIVR